MSDPAPTTAGGPALLEPAAPRAKPMKFAYASGSRPLDGYTVKRGVGVGGFGEVYFAVTDAGKEVALKRVQRNLDVELRGVSTCLNLKHQHLVALYDIKYDADDQAWVVMEYVNGESLKDVIDRNPSGLPLDEVKSWFTGVAAGVGYLHDHGIVHRDLKPGNLFLDEGIVKIGDYGLSKFISTSRRSGQTESVGTFHYMAPEIGRGNYGREIDIYALGIVLYEMLTGRVPFEGESSQEIIMKHLTADVDVRGLPQPYADVISKAMKKTPEQRYHDVSEMLAALGYIHDRGTPVTPRVESPVAVAAGTSVPFEIVLDEHNTQPEKPEPLYIGEESPAPLAVSPGIEFGDMKEQPPVVGGVRKNGRAHQPAAPSHPRPNHNHTPRNGHNGRPMAVAAIPEAREPIAAAMGKGAQSFGVWWNDSRAGTPLKVVLILAVGVALVFNATWLVPLAIAAGVLYIVYYGIWVTVTAWNEPVEEPATTASGTRRNNFRRVKWQDHARETLRRRSPSEKVAELTSSLLMSAIVSAVLGVIMLIIGAQQFDGSVQSLALYAWFALSTTLGSWLVLASGRPVETKGSDQVRRRFALLILGLVFGAASFGVQQLLMVETRNIMDFPHITDSAATAGAYEGQLPLLPAYLAYFAGIFVVLRWWKQVDPLRTTRLSIWTTGVCVLWAAVLEMFWHFPQPWGLMLVASISIAAQLSAPWLTPRERQQLREQAMAVPARA
jgi:serine/threonine protein kinase